MVVELLRGARRSGRQRQRLWIARALARRPRLLVLHEATRALDPEREAAICETLARLPGKMTTLAVSHQSGLASISNQVLRLTNGALVAAESSPCTFPEPRPRGTPRRSAA